MALRRGTGLTGAAGEYYVAAELSRRGWLATVTIKNAPGTDVLAQRVESALTVAIQTKTSSRGSAFRLGEKDERPAMTAYEWYVLVGLKGELERPEFFILPRDFVAAFTWVGHRRWLSEEGRNGPHKDSQMRSIRGEWIGDFRERWDILERPTHEVSSAHDTWVLEQARSFGLPEGHPWAGRLGTARGRSRR